MGAGQQGGDPPQYRPPGDLVGDYLSRPGVTAASRDELEDGLRLLAQQLIAVASAESDGGLGELPGFITPSGLVCLKRQQDAGLHGRRANAASGDTAQSLPPVRQSARSAVGERRRTGDADDLSRLRLVGEPHRLPVPPAERSFRRSVS
jgi:hypothetical protein